MHAGWAQVGRDSTLEDLIWGEGGFLGPARAAGGFLGPTKLQDPGSWVSRNFALGPRAFLIENLTAPSLGKGKTYGTHNTSSILPCSHYSWLDSGGHLTWLSQSDILSQEPEMGIMGTWLRWHEALNHQVRQCVSQRCQSKPKLKVGGGDGQGQRSHKWAEKADLKRWLTNKTEQMTILS